MRVCECGCGESMEGRDPRARYANDLHRTRDWKAKTLYGPQKPLRVRSNGHSGPSGRQISYRKAVNVLVAHLSAEEFHWVEDDDDWRQVVEGWLADALPERQRP